MRIGDTVKYTRNFVRILGDNSYTRRKGVVIGTEGRKFQWVVVHWDDGELATLVPQNLRVVTQGSKSWDVAVETWLSADSARVHGSELIDIAIEHGLNPDPADGVLGSLMQAGRVEPIEYAPTPSQAAAYGLERRNDEPKPGTLPEIWSGRRTAFFYKKVVAPNSNA